MDATTYELQEVLGRERRLLIPTFQRDYEWTEQGQWALLFDDLVNTADRLRSARERDQAADDSSGRAEKGVAPHFLGAIVLDQIPSRAGDIDQRAVIDGQQRITTVQLLLRALSDVLAEQGSPRAAKIRRLLFNPLDDPAGSSDVRYKVWPRRKDRQAWRAALDDDPSKAPHDHLYGQARRWFALQVRAVTTYPDGGDIADRLPADPSIDSASVTDAIDIDTLVDAALSLFKLVTIDLDANDDAQVIFEVLNGRQTPLSAADLVKNLLFLRAEIANQADLENLYDRYWAPLETNWWKETVGRGHAARHRRELLLAAWLSAQTGEEANVGRLYGEIRSYLTLSDRKVNDVLAEISAYTEASVRLADPDSSIHGQRTADSYRRINYLGITTAQPLLLWLETRHPDCVTPHDRHRVALAVESWAIRRLVTHRNTRGYGKALLGVLNAAKSAAAAAGAVSADIANAAIGALASGHVDWPTDREVIAAFESEAFYGYHAPGRIRLILGALDQALAAGRPKSEPAVFDYDGLQIEHLMPQGWREHWPLSEEEPAAKELAEGQRDRAIHRIGNLTLLTDALNPSISNADWATKQPHIARHSRLQLNRDLSEVQTWDEHRIAARGRELGMLAITVWPAPDERLVSV